MATVSYSWAPVVASFFMNDATITGNQGDVAIASTSGGLGYVAAWDSVGDVHHRIIGADGTPGGSETVVNTTLLDNQFDPSLAVLTNGSTVTSFTDHSSGTDTVRIRVEGSGAPASDFAVTGFSQALHESDVTALGTGFAVAFTRVFSATDLDLFVQRYNADGTLNGSLVTVDNSGSLATSHASIASLASGGFVTAWEQTPVAGGDHSTWFQLFDAAGAAVGAHHLIDSFGSINQDIQVAALQDGGFAVAYTDNGWNLTDTDITTVVFNADGSQRSSYLEVNTTTAGNQDHATLTVLSNGYYVVGWTDEASGVLEYQAYDPNGVAIGSNYAVHSSVVEGEIAGLTSGLVGSVWESTFTDGDGNSVRSSVEELTRTTVGDGTNESLSGDSLRDIMDGGAGNDTLNGGAGNDTLTGGVGADVLIGGTGVDTASYAGSVGAVNVSLVTGLGSSGDAAGDTLSGIENLIGGASGDSLSGDGNGNYLTGNAGNDTLDGAGGNDHLDGGDGDDVVTGGAGADVMTGGNGTDTANYSTSVGGVNVNLGTGLGVAFEAQGDILTGFENVTGGAGSDFLRGDGNANVLTGNGGNDTMLGYDGTDTLNGGDGNDSLNGGAGADVLIGGAGTDTATYADATGAVTVNLATGLGSGAEAQGDTLSGIENLIGGSGSDTLTGDANANGLTGNAGADTLNGGDGNDTLVGGAGPDVLIGGAGVDLASYAPSTGGVNVNLTTGVGAGSDAAGDTLTGVENVTGGSGNDWLRGDANANILTGSAGNDTLQGFGGGDTLNGGDGNDALYGGAGKDNLVGGAGADKFVYTAIGDSPVGGSASSDAITDFSHAQGDKIDLSAIDANSGVAGDQAFSFIGAGAFTHHAGELRAETVAGVTSVYGDVNGDGTADFQIRLSGTIVLVAGDFVL